MSVLIDSINQLVKDIKIVIKTISKYKQAQIKSVDDREYVSAHIYLWFSTIKPLIKDSINESDLNKIDDLSSRIIKSCKGYPSKSSLLTKLKEFENLIVDLSSNKNVLSPSVNYSVSPDFNGISQDPKIQEVLKRRWKECDVCVHNGAIVASLVMIGGLIEALLMAKVNQTSDKSKVFKANSAPKDKTGNTLQLKEWTLKDYINVAFELKWIGISVKDISSILRDYRNYIHPYKEVTSPSFFQESDISLIWEVSKKIINELS